MLKIYGIYDKKAESFTSAPFFNSSHASAIRMITDFISTNPDTVTAMHPEDFTLYYLGDFSQEDGLITGDKLELAPIESLKVVEYSEV